MTTSTSYPRNGAAPATPPQPQRAVLGHLGRARSAHLVLYALAHRHDGDDLYDARRR